MPVQETIAVTNLELPGQIGEPYHGKVADVYTLDHEIGRLLVAVRTDRISAYDVVLPQAIPFKGQVLNEMSSALLQESRSAGPNWYIDSPDPNVTIGHKAEPIKVEMIARGYLLGSSWKAYEEEGLREIGGIHLADTMREFDPFGITVITPTTKAEEGHDEPITPEQIIEQGLASEDEYSVMEFATRALFILGQDRADKRGMVLADTKYEFGRLPGGKIKLIDEVHTPDSSRYFDLKEYEDFIVGKSEKRPEQLSKEFIREWLKDQGFTGQQGEKVPDLTEEVITEVSQKYMRLYERMLNRGFKPEAFDSLEERVAAMQIRIDAKLTEMAKRLTR